MKTSIISSLSQKNGRYKKGGTTETDNNDRIEWWERAVFESHSSDIKFMVSREYEQRIDSIAYLFYADHKLGWFICQYNNVIDPLSEVVEGRILWIPSKVRMEALLSSSKPTIATLRVEKK